MSYFLGFVPDKESVKEIQNVVKEANSLFSDFGIPVRWVKPDTYHITLYYLGENLSFFNQILLKKKLSKIKFFRKLSNISRHIPILLLRQILAYSSQCKMRYK